MKLNHLSVQLGTQTILNDLNWSIEAGQSWALLGTNASGKSTLAKLICGELDASKGELTERPHRAISVSLENQQAIYEQELYRDDSDFMDRIDHGSSVRQLMEEIAPWSAEHDRLVAQLRLETLLTRGYRLLSSGEARKVMIARALLQQPELLILDEPFEGLDANSREELQQRIKSLIQQGYWLILMVNQLADLGEGFSKLAILDKGRLVYSGDFPEQLEQQWQTLTQLNKQPWQLPERQSKFQLADWPNDKPLVDLKQGFVQYDDRFQFRDLDWQLLPGQHTQIAGPNGCGKSTLIGLITGDHPQCYRNDLTLFGYQRGQGESIWQIKKHLGYVSGSLHRDYRVSGNALTAVVSGLTDSIGLYQAVAEQEKALAMHWLDGVGLKHKAQVAFRQLSMGEQRLVLIARALIKQPPLLILDEPTQGLDDFNRYWVLQVIERIIQQGPTTLLFVSHRQDESLSVIHHRLNFLPQHLPQHSPQQQQDALYHIAHDSGQ
ncbi:molybdate ABC transporter ATP-binding protein ModF [Reinekea thalattae]|uniref:Molybdate ABC transporter ATP-binding protein ModF n=1 Tax=Reinekea thalattae TaxID=2593301 RepID=A0A5C8ZA71_9GAMM|nr:molybdate ABC transporter ATP-binding protein ModF [Reinekea thalattae]TXR54667.1 molybdate ABC transporter ATP-binding protein ModF [Reinekea thalattae]